MWNQNGADVTNLLKKYKYNNYRVQNLLREEEMCFQKIVMLNTQKIQKTVRYFCKILEIGWKKFNKILKLIYWNLKENF